MVHRLSAILLFFVNGPIQSGFLTRSHPCYKSLLSHPWFYHSINIWLIKLKNHVNRFASKRPKCGWSSLSQAYRNSFVVYIAFHVTVCFRYRCAGVNCCSCASLTHHEPFSSWYFFCHSLRNECHSLSLRLFLLFPFFFWRLLVVMETEWNTGLSKDKLFSYNLSEANMRLASISQTYGKQIKLCFSIDLLNGILLCTDFI